MTSSDPQLHPIGHACFVAYVETLADRIAADDWSPDLLVGIGRGGLVPTVYLSHRLDRPMLSVDYSGATPDRTDALFDDLAARSRTGVRLLIIDDINDSGGTIGHIRRTLGEKGGDPAHVRFAMLLTNSRSGEKIDYWAESIDRETDKRWFVFPWEALASRQAIVEEALSVPDRLA
jgi:hypoxanthine phosphoribosyltransferase